MRRIVFILLLCCCALPVRAAAPLDATASTMSARLRTVAEYEEAVRNYFRIDEWQRGKKLLDDGIKKYPESSAMNELMGAYFLHIKDYIKARFFLVRALRLGEENDKARYMLVTVEEDTKNYSSAICYINELLESEPFNRELWYKRANLYRMQGNVVEADRELERLMSIYPNDTNVRKLYMTRMEEQYEQHRREGGEFGSVATLRKLINMEPPNPKYYIELCNLYIRHSNKSEALAVAEEGIFRLHGNSQLAMKKLGILSEQHRWNEALSFIRDYSRAYGDVLESQRSGIEELAALDAVSSDPYVLMGRRYERTRDADALVYLTNTSFIREYNEDALDYIQKSLKLKPNDSRLLYMQYVVYRRMGYRSKGIATLYRLHELHPSDDLYISELSFYNMQDAVQMMTSGLYDEAIKHLDFIINNDTTAETLGGAVNRKLVCLAQLGRYDDALKLMQRSGASMMGERNYYLRYAELLAAKGEENEALQLLESVAMDYDVADGYEEIALPYIKSLMERGAVRKAYVASRHLLAVKPNSRQGLLYMIGASDILGRDAQLVRTLKKARELYPDDIDILAKQIAFWNRVGDYRSSLTALEPYVSDSVEMDERLIAAYSASVDLMANRYMKNLKSHEAISLIDSALTYDPDNNALLYDKGLAYEKLGLYDSALYYQSHYVPDDMERSEFVRHQRGLAYRSFDDELSVNYLQSRFGDKDEIHGLASASYSHRKGANTYSGTLNYAGRDGKTISADANTSGGAGVQLLVGWQHEWNERNTTRIGAGWANRYMPMWQFDVRWDRYLRNDWSMDLHSTYRYVRTVTDDLSDMRSLANLGVGVLKDFDAPFRTTGKVDLYYMSDRLMFNVGAEGRYFPFDDKTSCVLVQSSLGTAPEADIIKYNLPAAYYALNTSVGLGAVYLFTPNLSAMLMGTWQTFYTEDAELSNSFLTENYNTYYKNLYNVYIQLNLKF